MKRSAIFYAMLGLGGCTTIPSDPVVMEMSKRDVTCVEGADCDAKWSRAVSWVAQNSHWKIQTQTNNLIQTMGPFDSTDAAFTITKVASGNGTYTILFNAGCGNIFGCLPSIPGLKVMFNQFVDPQ